MLPWNIVLDVDGTLVEDVSDEVVEDEYETPLPAPRPYLTEFMQFCFAEFQHVAIWSAASSDWIDPIIKNIIPPPPRHYHFIWANKHISRSITHQMGRNVDVRIKKKLKKVCNHFPEFTLHNTLILDDTPQTYRDNYGNAVGISRWYGSSSDTELVRVMKRILDWKTTYQEQRTVRHISKC